MELQQEVSAALNLQPETTATETVTQQSEVQTATPTPEAQPQQVQTQEQTTQTENPVRQLRQQYDKASALLKRIAESKGLTVDELANSLQDEEDKKRAQSLNIPLEVQQQMRSQEEKIKNLELQNLRNDFDIRANRLKAEYQLNENQIIDFAETAKKAGFNIFTPGVDLVTLYRAMNYDTLTADLRNTIRQEVLAELQNSNANVINNIPGTQQPTANNSGNDMNANDFMASLFQNLGR